MSASATQRTVQRACSERELMAAVIELARWRQWTTFHPFDSRRSHPGWPDLALWRGGEFLVVELKTDRGRVSAAQRTCLDGLAAAGIETHIWREAQWHDGTIEERLR